MQFAHPSSQQVFTVFGGEYVAEQHSDKTYCNLSTSNVDEVIESLTASMFNEVMRSLRSALSLR